MLINDVTPRKGFTALYERDIAPRMIELSKLMGTYKKIDVQEHKPYVHFRDLRTTLDGRIICHCADCYGDFSGADDE